MGCGTSNQVHEIHHPISIDSKFPSKQQRREQNRGSLYGKCYLFGQTLGERKVVLYDANYHQFTTQSSRIRIPASKYKMEPIQILYEETQQIILPELLKKGPSPPFNRMFGTLCKPGVIFLCGGANYELDQVYNDAYFYTFYSEQEAKPKSTITTTIPSASSSNKESSASMSSAGRTTKFIKFEQTVPCSVKRYCHTGAYFCEKANKNEYIFIFGGRNNKHEAIDSCQRFDIFTRKWKDIKSMFEPRAEATSIVFMDNIYVFGGVGNFKQYSQNIEVYSPKYDSWNTLNIRLHRGIRSCLVVSPKPNEIMILGGITSSGQDEKRLSTSIRVNFLSETYIWETDMPEPLSSIKHVHQFRSSPQPNKAVNLQDNYKSVGHEDTYHSLTLFSNESNTIYTYDVNNKIWKSKTGDENGYKNYVPVGELSGFTAVGQRLEVKANVGDVIPEQPSSQFVKINENAGLSGFYLFGNQNYPCIIKPDPFNKSKLSLSCISMKLHPKSSMCIYPGLHSNYYVIGGCDFGWKHSSSSCFLFNPQAATPQNQIQQLKSVQQPKHNAGIAVVTKADKAMRQQQSSQTCTVYSFGGIRDNKNGRNYLKNIEVFHCTWEPSDNKNKSKQGRKGAQQQEYGLSESKWENIQHGMVKPLSNVKTCVIQDQETHNDFIVILGGTEQNGNVSSLAQLYNCQYNEIGSYAQFPCLTQSSTSLILCEQLSNRDIQKLNISEFQEMLQIAQYYSNKESIEKQKLVLPSPVRIKIEPVVNQNNRISFKNLALENIPAKARKSQEASSSEEKVQIQKQINKQIYNKTPAKPRIADLQIDVEEKPRKKQISQQIQPKIINEDRDLLSPQPEEINDNLMGQHRDVGSDDQNLELMDLSPANKNVQKLKHQNNQQDSSGMNLVQASSEQSSLLTKNNLKQLSKPKQDKTNYQQQYYVLRVFAYGLKQQQQVDISEQHKFANSVRIYYLLVHKKTFAISLVRDPEYSGFELDVHVPLHYTHNFTVRSQPGKHYLADLRSTYKHNKAQHEQANMINSNDNNRILIYTVDTAPALHNKAKKVQISRQCIEIEGMAADIDIGEFSVAQQYF